MRSEAFYPLLDERVSTKANIASEESSGHIIFSHTYFSLQILTL